MRAEPQTTPPAANHATTFTLSNLTAAVALAMSARRAPRQRLVEAG